MESPSQLDKEDEDYEPVDEEDDDDYMPGKKKKPKKKKKQPPRTSTQKSSQFQFVAEIPIEFDVEPFSKSEKSNDSTNESTKDHSDKSQEGNSQDPPKKKPRKMVTPQRNRNDVKRVPSSNTNTEEAADNTSQEKDPLAITNNDAKHITPLKPISTDRFPCGYCDTVFTDISFLERHHKRCKAKRTAESISLAQRGFINVSKPLPPYTPSVTGRFMYSCDKCSFSTKNPEHLKYHRPIHNTEEQYFSCNQCKFSCRDAQQLEKHKELHSNREPYANNHGVNVDDSETAKIESNEGNKELNKDVALDSNGEQNANVDSTVKPEENTVMYTCDQCNYTTSRQGYLIMHKKIHVRDQPYQCVDCGYKCSRLAYFKKHRATHGVMDDTLVSCDRCSFTTSSQNVLDSHKLCHKV